MFFPPIQPNIKQSEKKNQKYNLYQYLKAVLLTREVAYNGKNNKTNIEHNNNITPPNLSGTDLNIA
jgi:hypothetical protein